MWNGWLTSRSSLSSRSFLRIVPVCQEVARERLPTRAMKSPSNCVLGETYFANSAFNLRFLSVGADGDALDPSPKLRQRNAVRRGRMPHLDLESSARCDRIRPTVLLQQTKTHDRGFVQAVGGNVDAVPNARWAGEAESARLCRHRRTTIALS